MASNNPNIIKCGSPSFGYLFMALPDLEVSVDDVIELKVVVVITERIDEALGYFKPAKVENELNDREEWEVEIFPVVVITQNESSHRSFLHWKQDPIFVQIPGGIKELPGYWKQRLS